MKTTIKGDSKGIDPVCFHVIGVTASGGAKIDAEWVSLAALHRLLLRLRFVGWMVFEGAAS